MVKSLMCNQCHTEVTGIYPMPVLASLTMEDQQFIAEFVLSSGSLKEMAQKLGLSYPTVRNMLDDIINRLANQQSRP
jgi:hypothetical protein